MIYRARYVLPMDGSLIEDGEVVVEGDRIAVVGPRQARTKPGEGVRDLGDVVLMPGFVNAHTHLDYTASRASEDGLNLWDWIDQVGFRAGKTPDYSLLLESATDGAVECARSGVTCVGDSTFSGAAVQAVESVGLRGVVYREAFGQSMGVAYPERFASLLQEVRRTQAQVSSRVTIGVSPHTVYTSNRGLLELCARVCAEEGIPVAIHLAETRAETDYLVDGAGPLADWRKKFGYAAMAAGMRPGRYLHEIGLLRKGVCLAHCVHLDDEEIDLIAASGASVAHCARSNALLGAGVAPVAAMEAAGVCVSLGTDSSASALSLNFFEEMRFAMAIRRAVAEDAAAVTAKHVLRQATLGGAEALGLARSVGSLEAGKKADMIAIDASAILPGEELYLAVLSRSPDDVLLVLVDGRTVIDNLEL